MKLSEFGPAKKNKEKEKDSKGSWTKSREQFVKLKPLDLRAMPDNVLVCSVAHRPYLSKVASMEGIEYATLGLGNGLMAVFRYKKGQK